MVLFNYSIHLLSYSSQIFIVGALGYGDVNDRGGIANNMGDYLPTINLPTSFQLSSSSYDKVLGGGWDHNG